MEVFRQLQVLCVALIVAHIGAELNLTVVTSMTTLFINGTDVEVDFECGSRVTFVCEIKPYGTQAAWEVNSKTCALCLFQSCVDFPPFPAYHEFSMSLATETFNLTTNPITLASQRSIYSCNDGVTAMSVDAIVKVYVKNETLEMDTSRANQITLTTGCVYPFEKGDLAFKWFISKDRVLLEKSRFVQDEMQSIAAYACAETSDCASADSMQFNSTVTVIVDIFDNGDDYHICASVQHIDEPDRPSVVHCSVKTYNIRNITVKHSPSRTVADLKCIFIICCVYRLIFIAEFGFHLYKKTNSFACPGYMGVLIVGLLLPGLGFYLLKCKKGIYCYCKLLTTLKMAFYIFSFPAIDSAIIVLSLVLEKTELWFCTAAAITCIILAWTIRAIIFTCIHDRLKCKSCTNLPEYMCKVCNMNYCSECVKKDKDDTEQLKCAHPTCMHCQHLADYKCKLCNKNYCKQCVKKDECETNKKLICGECNKAQNEMKTYCCKCKKFLCNSCLKMHAICNDILLKHPQQDIREESIMCGTAGHISSDSAHAYCLGCKSYICKECLETSHEKHSLVWIRGDFDPLMFGRFSKERDRLCCENVKSDITQPEDLGYCSTCELYICLPCSETHRGNKHCLFMHIPKESMFDTNNKQPYCESNEHSKELAECYSYTEHAYLCAECFEKGIQSDYRNPTLKKMLRKCNPCELHTLKNNEIDCRRTDAYCLFCDVCLCRICFSIHRRFKDHYIKTHERNAYFCKQCQSRGHYFPVECVKLDSFTLSCAECFEKTEDIESKPQDDKELGKALMSNFSKGETCQIHKCKIYVTANVPPDWETPELPISGEL